VWDQLLRGEMTREQRLAIYRRATATRPELVAIENSNVENSTGHAA
jgi:hypothetical protein